MGRNTTRDQSKSIEDDVVMMIGKGDGRGGSNLSNNQTNRKEKLVNNIGKSKRSKRKNIEDDYKNFDDSKDSDYFLAFSKNSSHALH